MTQFKAQKPVVGRADYWLFSISFILYNSDFDEKHLTPPLLDADLNPSKVTAYFILTIYEIGIDNYTSKSYSEN